MAGAHDRPSGSLAEAAESLAKAPADTLSDVLEAVRLTGALFFVVDASTPWVAAAPSTSHLAPAILPRVQHVVSYHVITRGSCWCEIEGQSPVRVAAGDVIIIPHGDAYALSSVAGLRPSIALEEGLAWFRQMAAGQMPFVVTEGGGGAERIGVFCGFLGCDALPFNPALAGLPRLVHLRAEHRATDRIGSLIELAVEESGDPRAGGRSVLLRIGELMFVEVVRRYLSSVPVEEGGWLAALRDPLVGRALAALHESPAEAWTLEALARNVGTSRSVLTQRFTSIVGRPPMQYLAAWRVQLAARRLLDGSTKVAAVAREVGYESEAAFSRAFKRLTGSAPTAWRRR
jgi:AraC-like DNA-binding protein